MQNSFEDLQADHQGMKACLALILVWVAAWRQIFVKVELKEMSAMATGCLEDGHMKPFFPSKASTYNANRKFVHELAEVQRASPRDCHWDSARQKGEILLESK